MSRLLPLLPPTLLGVLAGSIITACVTINVYFPEAAAERAADRIIEEVWGPESRDGSGNDQTRRQLRLDGTPRYARAAQRPPLALALLNVLVPPAQAQGQADLDINTPEIRSLTSAMNQRFSDLRPLFDAGAIGLTRDGLIEIRDRNAVPLNRRSALGSLVAAENRDRNELYAAIARANGHPEWEDDIRRTFAQRWVSRAESGWYYRSSAGAWTRK